LSGREAPISDKGYHLGILTAKLAQAPSAILTVETATIIFVLACSLTALGLWLFLRMQPRLGLIDVPNERSSHTRPVPRGGGVVIVLVALSIYSLGGFVGSEPSNAFIVAALMIAAISLVDDIRSIPFIPRLIVHIIFATIIVWETGGFSSIGLPGIEVTLRFGVLGPIISVLFIVWTLNAYNFMDGIDGILGIQGLVAGTAFAVFGMMYGSVASALLGTAVAGCCLGFLIYNWQPARVFCGDVGSTFLGFAFACAPLFDTSRSDFESGALSFAVMFSFLFLFDTVYTRILLVVRGGKFWRPHREHLYQQIVHAGVPHAKVALFFGIAGTAISAASLTPATRPYAVVIGIGAGLYLLVWSRRSSIVVDGIGH
jgi:Fuc2NAc and GlcNAc transferase